MPFKFLEAPGVLFEHGGLMLCNQIWLAVARNIYGRHDTIRGVIARAVQGTQGWQTLKPGKLLDALPNEPIQVFLCINEAMDVLSYVGLRYDACREKRNQFDQ